jgi:alcohol dehydrogenase
MQTEFFGTNSLQNIKKIISDVGAKKILLVTGKDSYIKSGAEEKLSKYLDKIYVERYYDFEVNPKIEDVYFGVSIVQKMMPDLIIAIGGGTVIDMAKLINILSSQSNHSFINIIKNSSLISKKGMSPLVSIPTTSGTGSEATHFAVVYVEKRKYSLAHKFMLPEYVIVDSLLSNKIPKKIAASVAIDALSQAIESYWSVGASNKSKQYAEKAIEIILSSIGQAVNENDQNAKDLMAIAANLSGKAINISKTTAAHAISYPISTHFNVPHGHAVGLLLGCFFEINANFEAHSINDSRGVSYVKNTMLQLFKLFGVESSLDCKLAWYKIMNNIGLETKISKLGVCSPEDIDLIVNNVNIERLNNNPVIISVKTLKNLLRSIS